MKKSWLLKTVPWLLAGGLLVWVLRAVPLADTWNALRQLQWHHILLLIALNALILIMLNGRWWIILRGHGWRISFLSLFGYRVATFGVSYFTPGPHFGGEPLQVLLVEHEQRVPRVTAVAAMSLDKSLELLVNFLFLLSGVLIILQQQTLDGLVRVEAALIVTVLLLFPAGYLLAIWANHTPLSWVANICLRLPMWKRKPSWRSRVQRAQQTVYASEKETSQFIRRAPIALFLALLLSIVSWMLMIGEFWLMISFLGTPLSPLQLVTALTAARIAILLLLPAGIGALEASQALAFGTMDLNPALGISASLLIRGRDVILGSIGLWWGSRKLARRQKGKQLEGGRIT
jgi:uncharacterized protein (TIRG00374 family)